MKELLTKAWNWLVKSSADPTKLAVTVKGGVPLIVSVALLLGVELPQDSLAEALTSLVMATSGIITAAGLIRKVVLSVRKKEGV